MKEVSWFKGSKKDTCSDEGIIKRTGKGIVTVGTLIGAGVLLGLGIDAVVGD